QVFFGREVIVNAGGLDADQRGQVPIAEAVVAALLDQALGVLHDLCADGFSIHGGSPSGCGAVRLLLDEECAGGPPCRSRGGAAAARRMRRAQPRWPATS